MLGRAIHDPQGIEGAPGSSEGLRLLDVTTTLEPVKHLRIEHGIHLDTGTALSGYHMHMGITTGPDTTRAFSTVAGRPDGATSQDGSISGTYMHGIFVDDTFRHAFLHITSDVTYEARVDSTIDALAAHVTEHLDLDALFALAEPL